MATVQVRSQVVVGRQAEIALVEARLGSGSAQLPYTFLIAGDAGIGKSALVRVFSSAALAAGAQVFMGECTSVEVGRPFGPIAEVLVRAQREPRTRAVVERALADPDLRLLAVLRGDNAEGLKATDPSERYRTHAAILVLLGKLSEIRPLVVVLEDLHWADDATLEFLPYAVRKLKSERLLFVVTYRSDELHRLHSLVPVLAELRRAKSVEELRLGPLGRADTAAMIQLTLGLEHPPDVQLRDAIFERCEGNPYFIEEVLRTLPRRGDGFRQTEAPVTDLRIVASVPASIRDALWVRLAALDAPTRRIAQLAAVIGQGFDFDLLQRVSGERDQALLAALRALIDAHIVDEALDAAGRAGYMFRHALMREAVLGELLERQRQSLHRVVGLALEEIHSDRLAVVADDLAYQFDAAGDQARAGQYHQLAAQRATGIFAFKSASRHLQRAIALTPNDDETLIRLELQLAHMACLASIPSLAVRVCETALARAARPGDENHRGAIGTILSDAHWLMGNRTGSDTAMSDSIEALAPLGPSADLARAYALAASRTSIAGERARAFALGEQAIGLARRFDVPDALARSLLMVGEERAVRGDSGGIAQIREAIDIGLKHQLVDVTLAAYGNLVMALTALGATPADRRQVHEESVAVARRFGHYRDRLLSHDVDFLVADANWDAALRESTEIGDTIWREAALLQVALIHALRDGPAEALREAAPHRDRLLAALDPQWVARAASFSAVALLTGDPRTALMFAEDLGRPPRGSGALTWTALTQISAIASADELGDTEAKRDWIERALADPRPVDARISLGARAFARAASEDTAESALERLVEAVALLQSEVLPLAEVIVRLWRARVCSRMRGRSAQDVALSDVLAVQIFAKRAGATWFLQWLRRWSEEHALRSPDQATAAKGLLTARESEIAGLVAHGLTNKEIAERLVIAARTAEGHVEHILNKLGFHSRSQIATWSTKKQVGPAQGSADQEKRVPTNE